MADQAATELAFSPRPAREMPELVRAKDWSATPLGPMETWSPGLRLALDIVLSSGFPMALRWGPEFVLIYNDDHETAFRHIVRILPPGTLVDDDQLRAAA